MKRYSVTFQVYATMFIEVDAESKEEAEEKAFREAYEPTLCHQCANDVEICSVGDIVAVEEIG